MTITTPKFRLEPYSDSTSVLHCPRCGGDYLHHGTVTVFSRAEDDSRTHVYEVGHLSSSSSVADSASVANPSSRRDGLTINFRCEFCSTEDDNDFIELTIAQHKGNTELGWRFSPRVDEPDNIE